MTWRHWGHACGMRAPGGGPASRGESPMPAEIARMAARHFMAGSLCAAISSVTSGKTSDTSYKTENDENRQEWR
jgi:hypothetical protein